MARKDLHPSIQEFKAFVKKHPGLVKDVRKGNGDWQSYYEKWVLLGEEDPTWEKYKTDEKSNQKETKDSSDSSKKDKQELMSQIMKMVENVDLNKVEGHVNQLNGAISNIQTLIGQFQDVKKQFGSKNEKQSPFHINKD